MYIFYAYICILYIVYMPRSPGLPLLASDFFFPTRTKFTFFINILTYIFIILRTFVGMLELNAFLFSALFYDLVDVCWTISNLVANGN